jgi:hypothetical protein
MLTLTRFTEATYPTHHEKAGQLASTLGRLTCEANDGEPLFVCRTIELPDRNNKTRRSRIPNGRYVAEVVTSSPDFDYPHVWIHDEGRVYAAGRAGIKIHVANFARQLEGCVGVGQEFVDLDGDGLLDVTDSEATLKQLVDVMPKKTELHVRSVADPQEVEPAGLEALDVGAPLQSIRILV